MVDVRFGRRAFVEALVAFPFAEAALAAQTSSRPVVKVASGPGGQMTSSSYRAVT